MPAVRHAFTDDGGGCFSNAVCWTIIISHIRRFRSLHEATIHAIYGDANCRRPVVSSD